MSSCSGRLEARLERGLELGLTGCSRARPGVGAGPSSQSCLPLISPFDSCPLPPLPAASWSLKAPNGPGRGPREAPASPPPQTPPPLSPGGHFPAQAGHPVQAGLGLRGQVAGARQRPRAACVQMPLWAHGPWVPGQPRPPATATGLPGLMLSSWQERTWICGLSGYGSALTKNVLSEARRKHASN